MVSKMIGYNPERSGGAFTFGGTGTTFYGVKLGLEKADPGTVENGTSEDVVVFVSDTGHYCATNIVGWLGIGTKNLITIPTTFENEMDLDLLAQEPAKHSKTEKRLPLSSRPWGLPTRLGWMI